MLLRANKVVGSSYLLQIGSAHYFVGTKTHPIMVLTIDEMWMFLKSDGRHGDRNPNYAPIQSLVLLDVTQKGEQCHKEPKYL